jgi:hypothetical protein
MIGLLPVSRFTSCRFQIIERNAVIFFDQGHADN